MSKAVVVDISHLMYRHLFASKQAVIDNPRIVAHLLINSLYLAINQFQISRKNPLIASFDCTRENNWRTKFFEENKPDDYKWGYKGTRIKDQSIPWDRVAEIIEDVKAFLRDNSDVHVLSHKNAEADDIIAMTAKVYDELIIFGSDKDFRQLHTDKIRQYDPIKKAFIKEDNPERYLNIHILTGDASDSIKNVKRGMGIKTAEKWVDGGLEAYIETDKQRDSIRERFEFNKVLIDLKEVPDWIQEEILEELKNDNHFNYNTKGVIEFFRKYGLKKLGENITQLKFNHGQSIMDVLG